MYTLVSDHKACVLVHPYLVYFVCGFLGTATHCLKSYSHLFILISTIFPVCVQPSLWFRFLFSLPVSPAYFPSGQWSWELSCCWPHPGAFGKPLERGGPPSLAVRARKQEPRAFWGNAGYCREPGPSGAMLATALGENTDFYLFWVCFLLLSVCYFPSLGNEFNKAW